MRVPNDLQFDTETYLLFSIYYEAYGPFEVMDESAATYVKRFEKQIRGTGQVLEWLGLAIPDKNSPRAGHHPATCTSLVSSSRSTTTT